MQVKNVQYCYDVGDSEQPDMHLEYASGTVSHHAWVA